MTLRRAIALGSARVVSRAGRMAGRDWDEHLAGKYADRIDGGLLGDLARRIPTIALVTGTNGKTSTTALIARIAAASGATMVSNETGANLIGGLVGCLLRAGPKEVAVLEVDEVASGPVASASSPSVVVWLNAMRDQLHRFGDVDRILDCINASAKGLRTEGTLVVNADDPGLVLAARTSGKPVLYFGLEAAVSAAGGAASDAHACGACGTTLSYTRAYLAHLGDYACPGCGFRRPVPDVSVSIDDPREPMQCRITTDGATFDVVLETGGLGAAMNAAAAVAAARCMGVGPKLAVRAIAGVTAVAGRGTRMGSGRILLVKNASSANECLLRLREEDIRNVLVVANDGPGDGIDMSWFWDASFEWLAGNVDRLVVSGTRRHEVALRLACAGAQPDEVTADVERAVGAVANGRFAVVTTYFALHEVEAAVAKLRT